MSEPTPLIRRIHCENGTFLVTHHRNHWHRRSKKRQKLQLDWPALAEKPSRKMVANILTIQVDGSLAPLFNIRLFDGSIKLGLFYIQNNHPNLNIKVLSIMVR
jgi:hypothetical protein